MPLTGGSSTPADALNQSDASASLAAAGSGLSRDSSGQTTTFISHMDAALLALSDVSVSAQNLPEGGSDLPLSPEMKTEMDDALVDDGAVIFGPVDANRPQIAPLLLNAGVPTESGSSGKQRLASAQLLQKIGSGAEPPTPVTDIRGGLLQSLAGSPEVAIDSQPENIPTDKSAVTLFNGDVPEQADKLLQGRSLSALQNVSALSATATLNTAAVARTEATPLTSQPVIQTALGQAGWGQDMGQQVLWLASQNIKTAELRLNPQQLGPVQIRISIEGDQASVTFASHHGVVCDAVEAAIPRLKEMFGDSGLSLIQADVSRQALAGQQGQTASGDSGDKTATSDGSGETNKTDTATAGQEDTISASGLVDFYA